MENLTYGLLTITRKLGAHYIEKEGKIDFLTDEAIAICLPFGNSSDDCIKLKFYNNKFYFSIIKIFANDEGIGIIGVFNEITEVIEEKFTSIQKLFEILSLKMNYKSNLVTQLSQTTINERLLEEVDNIESALISLLINKKVFFLDSEFQIFSFIYAITILLPKKFHKLINFTINSTSFTENITLMSLPYSTSFINDLEELKKDNCTIVDIENKTCFGIYSSPVFTTIVKSLKHSLKDVANDFFSFLDDIIFNNNTINVKIKTKPKNVKLSKSDLKLIEQIKYNLLNIPQNNNLFEELIK